jgi:hypothetical protein
MVNEEVGQCSRADRSRADPSSKDLGIGPKVGLHTPSPKLKTEMQWNVKVILIILAFPQRFLTTRKGFTYNSHALRSKPQYFLL